MSRQLLTAFGHKMHIINPYRFVTAGGILVSDSFDDTDATALAGHDPEIDVVGGGWVVVAGTFVITGNVVEQTNAALSQYVAYIETNEADVVISASVATDINEPARILCRYTASNAYWVVEIHDTNNTFKIREYTGSFTDRASASVAISGFHEIEVTLSGATITATIDGGNEISYSSATMNQTATKHGLACFGDGSTQKNAWNDFVVSS